MRFPGPTRPFFWIRFWDRAWTGTELLDGYQGRGTRSFSSSYHLRFALIWRGCCSQSEKNDSKLYFHFTCQFPNRLNGGEVGLAGHVRIDAQFRSDFGKSVLIGSFICHRKFQDPTERFPVGR